MISLMSVYEKGKLKAPYSLIQSLLKTITEATGYKL